MSRKPDKPYQVGYGKPPSATRFKKGKSGNPSGRPKKLSTLDPGVILDSIDNEEIVVIDQGKRKRMTKAEIYIRQLFSSAIKGDMKAARQVVEMAADYLAPDYHNKDRSYVFIGVTEAIQRFGPNWRQKVSELNALAGY